MHKNTGIEADMNAGAGRGSFRLEEGESILFETQRRPEWGMMLACLLAALILIFMLWGASLAPLLCFGLIAVLLLTYSLRLFLAARHDRVYLTERRVILLSLDLFLREKASSCKLSDLQSYRVFESRLSEKRQDYKGDIELKLVGGKRFPLPILINAEAFLQKLRALKNTEVELGDGTEQ